MGLGFKFLLLLATAVSGALTLGLYYVSDSIGVFIGVVSFLTKIATGFTAVLAALRRRRKHIRRGTRGQKQTAKHKRRKKTFHSFSPEVKGGVSLSGREAVRNRERPLHRDPT